MIDTAISIQPQDAASLRELGRILRKGPAKLVGPKGDQAPLPKALYNLLKEIVQSLEEGHSMLLLPEEKQLTTQEAGDLLGMSRPFVIRLLDAGEMPFNLVGKHRRIALRDVLEYAGRRAQSRKLALDKMARDAYESGLYDNTKIPKGGRDK